MKTLKQIKFKKAKPNLRTKNLIEILFDRIYVAFNDHLFLQLHRNAKINKEGFRDFVLAFVCYQLDTDELLIMQDLNPKYKKYFDELWFESYEFVFWGKQFTRFNEKRNSKKARATLTSNFLGKCFNFSLVQQINEPQVNQNADEILFCILDAIKNELKKDWTEKLFIDDGGIVCS